MSKRNRHNPQEAPRRLSFAEVDVVIPYYGPADLMQKCLVALPAAAGEVALNVIVVDDFYLDGEEIQKIVAEIPYHITLVRNKENMGFGSTCNHGAKLGGAKYLLFLNTDVELLPHSIEIMVEGMNSDDTVSVIGPKLLFPEDSCDPSRPAGKVQHAGIEMNIRGDPFHIFCGWSRNNPKVTRPRMVPAVTGAAFLTRRADFIRVNGFDPLWGRGTVEDVDYCLKQSLAGKKTIYLPQAEGYHAVGASHTPYPLQQNLLIFKARWGFSLGWSEWELW
jgi:GT2 family glycosyltransferase